MFVRAAAERYAERRHHGVVKAARSGNVPNNELNMIDQAATIERLSFHEASPPFPTGEPSAALSVSCSGPVRGSEARRVGKACVSTGRSRGSPGQLKEKKKANK